MDLASLRLQEKRITESLFIEQLQATLSESFRDYVKRYQLISTLRH